MSLFERLHQTEAMRPEVSGRSHSINTPVTSAGAKHLLASGKHQPGTPAHTALTHLAAGNWKHATGVAIQHPAHAGKLDSLWHHANAVGGTLGHQEQTEQTKPSLGTRLGVCSLAEAAELRRASISRLVEDGAA